MKPATAQSNHGEWEFSGVELISGSIVALKFSSGGQMEIDIDKIGQNKSYTINNQVITVTVERDGVKVSVDGVGLYLPRLAA